MKKAIIVIVLLLATLFYSISADYKLTGVINVDGFVFTGNNIQTNLFSSKDEKITSSKVNAGEGIYQRLSTTYYGDENKVKVNDTYPMYINNGEAIEFLSSNVNLIDEDFNNVSGYKNLVINDGLAFNEDFERSDMENYIFSRLTNGLFIDFKKIEVKTYLNEYEISENSIIYFGDENINYYSPDGNGNLVYKSINDIDDQSIIIINGQEFTYEELLLKLGERIVVTHYETENNNNTMDVDSGSGGDSAYTHGSSKENTIGENSNTSGDNSKEKPQANKDAESPEEADETPETPSEEEKYSEVIVDWKLPKVSLGEVFRPGIYSLRLTLNVEDAANVINGGITFEILNSNGTVYKRSTVKTGTGKEINVLLNGFRPDDDYKVKIYYKILDKYARPYSEKDENNNTLSYFDVLENNKDGYNVIKASTGEMVKKDFSTLPLSTLGDIVIGKDYTKELYGNQISFDNIYFSSDSDYEAVSSIDKATYKVTKGQTIAGQGSFSLKDTNSLTSLQPIGFVYQNNIESNSSYDVNLYFYDAFGNRLEAVNDVLKTTTCKKLPETKLAISYEMDEQGKEVLGTVIFDVSLKNVDNLSYKNLSIKVYDENNKLVSTKPVTLGTKTVVDGLENNKNYVAYVVCTADNGDGKGSVERELLSRVFSTSSLAKLGSIYLLVDNLTSSVFSDERYHRAYLGVKLSSRTNNQLLSYIDSLSMSLQCGDQILSYLFTSEERAALIAGETVYIDTNKYTELNSNSIYNVSFKSYHLLEDSSKFDFTVVSSLKQLKTTRKPVQVLMLTPETATGYIATKIQILDKDDYVSSDNVLLKIYEMSETGEILIGSFNVVKNHELGDYTQIVLSNDAAYSTSGISYDIKGDTDYRFMFIADEANTEKGVEYGKPLIEGGIIVNTKSGITGDIYLENLTEAVYVDELRLPNGYQQVEYIESTAYGTRSAKDLIFIPKAQSLPTTIKARIKLNESILKSDAKILGSGGGAGNLYWANLSIISGNYRDTGIPTSKEITDIQIDLTSSSKKVSITYGGVTRTATSWFALASGGSNYGFSLMGGTETNSSGPQPASYKLYSFSMEQNGVVTFDGVPCYRKSDGVVGIYDVVNNEFYTNAGAGYASGGDCILRDDSSVENPDKLKANIDINIKYPKDWSGDLGFFVDVYKGATKENAIDTYHFIYDEENSTAALRSYDIYNLNNEYVDTVQFAYDETNQWYHGSFGYFVDKNEDTNIKYYFDLYYQLSVSKNNIPLDETSFSTEKNIYTIATIEQFYAVKSNNRKYVVIADIFETETTHHHYTSGKWGSTTFNAQIDFQGFSLNYTGNSPIIYKMSKTAEISNMVYKVHTAMLKSTDLGNTENCNNSFAGFLVYENYGKLTNVMVEYTEDQPEDIAKEGADVYRGETYWSDEDDHTTNTNHRYRYFQRQGALAYMNYGTIENFVIDVKTTINNSCAGGLVCTYNYGNVKNGYIFSSTSKAQKNSTTKDYKVNMNVYRSTYSNTGDNEYQSIGLVVGRNMTSGSYIGIMDSIYALCNINDYRTYGSVAKNDLNVGIICGWNTSVIKNTFCNGDVVKDKNVNKSYGPGLAYNASTVNRNPNNYYMSEYTYDNSYNKETSIIALRNKNWVNSVLNAESNQFLVNEMVDASCYPQIILPNVMPSQMMLELPELPSRDEVDVVYSNVLNIDENATEGLDAILNEKRSNNKLGDLYYGGNGTYTSDSQILELYVTDKSHSNVHSLLMEDPTLSTNVIYQINDGSDISKVYIEVYNPSQALTKYRIKGLYFKDYQENKDPTPYTINRYLNVSYTRMINSVDDWQSIINNPTQNHRLGHDIDFKGVPMSRIFVNSNFTGDLDGGGYTISNIEYDPNAFDSISGLSRTNGIGLFKSASGSIHDLTLENVNFEGGDYVGALVGTTNGADIYNVYVLNSYVAASTHAGGIVGNSSYTNIVECGVVNTKIVSVGGASNTTAINKFTSAGGIAGLLQYSCNIKRCFVNEAYIEQFATGFEYNCTGGLVGFIYQSGNIIESSYATGTINSNSYASGGLVGCNAVGMRIDGCYSDVDVNSYYGNAAGIVGFAYGPIGYDYESLVFGDVTSSAIIDNANIAASFSFIANGSDAMKGKYYNKAVLKSNTLLTDADGTAFNDSYVQSDSIYNDLFSGFVIDTSSNKNGEYKGILPKLIGADGELLPNQLDVYVSAYDSEVNISVNEAGSNIVINYDLPEGIEIENIYTDYSYINKIGVNTLTNHQALSYNMDMDLTNNKVTISNIDRVSFYDYYRVTAVKYSKREEGSNKTSYGIIRINHRLGNVSQGFKEIYDYNDNNGIDANWQKYVSGSIAENFKIMSDIDFSPATLNYYDEKDSNLVINRLIGVGTTAPVISNVNINTSDKYTSRHGWIYNNDSHFIKAIIQEMSNISFENDTISKSGHGAIIGGVSGSINKIAFKDCLVANTSTSNSYCVGLIGFSRAVLDDITIEDSTIDSHNEYTGIIGAVDNAIYGSSIYNVDVNNLTVKNSTNYTSFLIGYVAADYTIAGTSATVASLNIDNVKVENSNLTTTGGNIVGGLMGSVQSTTNYVNVSNCGVNNVSLLAKASSGTFGGILGNSGDAQRVVIRDTYVYNSSIISNSTSAGITGSGHNNIYHVTVKDCTIIGRNGSAAGIIGSNGYGHKTPTLSWQSCENDNGTINSIINCRIYGNEYVGGYSGSGSGNSSNIIIKDCDIRGNRYVGGIMGAGMNSYLNDFYVANTSITAWESAQEAAKYGVSYSSNQKGFGGISGWKTSFRTALVENCIIGGKNADEVGGLIGTMGTQNIDTVAIDSSVENSIIIGKDSVGSLIGKVSPIKDKLLCSNCYSNAYVYGQSNVGGIAGSVYGYKDSSGAYVQTIDINNVYFTGALNSKTNAGAFYGEIIGPVTNANKFFNKVSSFPKYIKAQTISPVMNNSEDPKGYSWSNLIEDKSNIMISLYDKTVIYNLDEDGYVSSNTTMRQLLDKEIYKNYVGITKTTAKDNYSLGVAGDVFITTYTDSSDIDTNFDTYSMHSSTTYVGHCDVTTDLYMPLYYSYSCFENNKSLAIAFNNLKYQSNKNPFDNDTRVYIENVQQGIAIPGTTLYNAEMSSIEGIYNLYSTGGLSATGIGCTLGNDDETQGKTTTSIRILPDDYQQVEYIQSTKTGTRNAADLIFIPNLTTLPAKINARIQLDSKILKSDCKLFGAGGGAGNLAYANMSIFQSAYRSTSIATTSEITDMEIELTSSNKRFTISYGGDTYSATNWFALNSGNSGYTFSLMGGTETNSSGPQPTAYKLYSFSIEQNGIVTFDGVPCYRKSDKKPGVYDFANGIFYTNTGDNYSYGDEVSSQDNIDKLYNIYSTDADKLNIALSDDGVALLNIFNSDAKVTIKIGDNVLAENKVLNKDNRIISMSYNFKDNISIDFTFTQNGKAKTLNKTITPSEAVNTMSLFGDSLYYIRNQKLYNVSNTSSSINSNSYVNIFGDSVLSSDGNVYKLSSLSTLVRTVTNKVETQANKLYSFTYSGKSIDDYGIYSIINGSISNKYRMFVKNGEATIVSLSSNPVPDPLYQRKSDGNTVILMLSTDKKVYSIGNTNIINKLAGFSNEAIEEITTNFYGGANDSNKYIGFRYTNGSMVFYDIKECTQIPLSTSAPAPASTQMSLPNFLMSKMAGLFSVSGSSSEELSGERAGTDKIVNLLNNSGISLNGLVEYAGNGEGNESVVIDAITNGEISSQEVLDEIGLDLQEDTNNINIPSAIDINVEDYSSTENQNNIESDNAKDSNYDINIGLDLQDSTHIESNSLDTNVVEDDSSIETQSSTENNDVKDNNEIITDTSVIDKHEYISVYNGETKEFDIVDVTELLNNAEEVVSENSKVVDKSTYKAIYDQLTEAKDTTTERGVALYCIVAVLIMVLLIPVFKLRKNS